MRAFVPSSREDQFFVGFNSENRGSGYEQRFEVDASGFGWSGDSRTKGPQLFEVTEPGIYLFSIWIKESGTIADKILLTRDQDFVPTGMGGAESPTGGGPPASAFVRGDANRNGGVDLSDGIAILQYLFTGSSPLVCEDHGDVDDNGRLETADALRLVEFLFLEGAPPAAPFPDPGLDPTTGDAHGCGDR
jgi:hypothetical protein